MSPHRTWDPDRFFWSVLEAPAWTGALPAGLTAAFESDAPLPLDQLHAVCAPAGPGMLIVCAARVAELRALDPSALSLTPEGVPERFGHACDPSRLNLLVGRFEPITVRRARRTSHLLAAAVVLVCAGLISVGLWRRGTHADQRAAAARAAVLSVAAREGAGDLGALELSVARARRSSSASAELRPAADAAPVLASILGAWPKVPATTQSITVGPQSISIEVALEGDAAAFVKGVSPPEGWMLEDPRMVRVEPVTRLSLRMRPAGGHP